MGNSSSNPAQTTKQSNTPTTNYETIIDFGTIEPQSNIYATSYLEYSRPIVHRLILERKLSPFYLGLDDFETNFDLETIIKALELAEAQATANLKEALAIANKAAAELVDSTNQAGSSPVKKSKEVVQAQAQAGLHRERLLETLRIRDIQKSKSLQLDKRELSILYQNKAIDCPICFLYYPPPLVHTRCCDQPICTECFVQIKRIDPTPTHLESEPAACPFCMEPNFGVIYPKQKDEVPPRPSPISIASSSSDSTGNGTFSTSLPPAIAPKTKPRRKSFAHTEKSVVTTDQVHPDWQQKLDSMKATVARRANRRIVFRQVGDRLIPVGITSGRASDGANTTMSTATLPPGFASQIAAALDNSNTSGGGGGNDLSTREGRRAARRRNEEMGQFLAGMGIGVGAELEEMMMVEAMRLSVLDDEERQRKVKEEELKAAQLKERSVGEREGEGADDDIPLGETYKNLLSEAIDSPIGRGNNLSVSPMSTYGTPSQQFMPEPIASTSAIAGGGIIAEDVFGEIISGSSTRSSNSDALPTPKILPVEDEDEPLLAGLKITED